MINRLLSANFQDPNKQFLFIAAVWVFLQVLLLKQFGVVTNFEASKYLAQATLLIENGHYESQNFIFYSTEILLIAFCLKLNIGLWLVVAIQLVANAASVFFFYKLIHRFTQNSKVAFFGCLVFLAMYYYQLYNVYLFTESLYFSLSIFFLYFLFTATTFTFSYLISILLFLMLLCITRPTGILFLPGTIFFLIFRFGKKRALLFSAITIITGFTGFYFLLNAALDSGGEFDFLLPYIEEHVICGVPTAGQPNKLVMPVNKNSVEGLLYIIQNNSELFLRLARQRFIAFWGVQRPFYSGFHNAYIAIYFYLVYTLIILGIWKFARFYASHTVFILCYVLLMTITVMLSCDEWHNRFLFALLPFLLLLASGLFIKEQTEIFTSKNKKPA